MTALEFIIKINDRASSPLAQIGNVGNTAFGKLSNGLGSFNTKLNTIGNSVNQLDAKMAALTKTRNMSINTSQIDKLNGELDTLQAKKDRLTGSSNSRGGLGSLFRQGLAIAGIGSLAMLGKDVVQSGVGRQMDLTSLQVLLGKNNGTAVNNRLLDFAKKSIYGNEVFNEGKLLAVSGVAAGNIMPIMKMIGDISNGDKEHMKSIALAFSEASASGRLNGRTNLMFRTALFNPLQQLSEMTKKPVAVLEKEMGKGKISIDDLVKSMQHATGVGGRWHDMMNKLMQSDAGKLTAFQGTMTTLAGTIGLKVLPILGKMAEFANNVISDPGKLKTIAAGITGMAVAWGVYTVATKSAVIWQGILDLVAAWPIVLVGAIAGGITFLCIKYDSWGKSLMSIWDIVKNSSIGIGLIYKSLFSEIGYGIEWLFTKIQQRYEQICALFFNIGKATALAMKGNFSGAGTALNTPLRTEAGARLAKLEAEHSKWSAANAYDIGSRFGKVAKAAGGIHFDLKNPKSVTNEVSDLNDKYIMQFLQGGGGSDDLGLGDTTKGITGGGVRNITINVQKFQDKTEIHTVGLKEGVNEIEEMIKDMFLRVVNSAATAMN